MIQGQGNFSETQRMTLRGKAHTRHGANCTTPAIMINQSGITLDLAMHGQIASPARVGDLSVLEQLYGHLDSISCFSSTSEYGHGDLCGIGTCCQMVLLVRKAVVSCSSMYKNCTEIATFAVANSAEGRHWDRLSLICRVKSMNE